jgi:SAM-dependent methyltransferase
MNSDPFNSYSRLCAEYYNLDKPNAPEDELNFYLHYAITATGPILEPMCGTGRFLIPMLEQGFDIEGFDASPHMLEILKQKCAQKNLKPTISQLFLQEFNSNKKYHLIFIPSGSFGLITNRTQIQQCLLILFNHLIPGGKFVFEIDTSHSFNDPRGVWQKSIHKKYDGSYIALQHRPSYDNASHIVEVLCRYEHIVNNTVVATEINNFDVKLYEYDELDPFLAQLGFSFVKYKAHQKAYATHQDAIIIYECTRNLT